MRLWRIKRDKNFTVWEWHPYFLWYPRWVGRELLWLETVETCAARATYTCGIEYAYRTIPRKPEAEKAK